LLSQVGLPGPIEILVVDGGSCDKTLDIVRSFPDYGTQIRIIPNPRRFQTYAWNIGIRSARGKYVALFSAHSVYADDYLVRCFEARTRTGAANVGGVQTPVGDGLIGRAVAWAMQSPFGVGNAHFRYTTKEQFVDAVYGAFFDKATVEAIGGYDESLPVNEDAEIQYRMRKAGHRIFLSPQIRVRYHVRSSLSRLAQQMFQYGFWRRKVQLAYPEYVPLRVLAPPLLIMACTASIIAFAFLRNPAMLAVPLLYMAFLGVAAVIAASARRSLLVGLAAPAVLSVMHFSYGFGWLLGLFVHRPAKS
jgi:glycosyltransferase involved in cell wall biosynthesis